MSHESAVYDLGEVQEVAAPVPQTRSAVPKATSPRAVPSPATPRAFPSVSDETPRAPLGDIADSLELFVPGSGQLLRARWSDGLFVLSCTGLLVALAWATWVTLERLPGTLSALGLPSQGGVYALMLIYAGLAGLHIGNVWCGTTRGALRANPYVAGCASALLPGWGQLLNRQPAKAAMFVAGLWTVGLAWLLAIPWTRELLAAEGLALRPGLEIVSSPALLWTAPIVLWALSIYDAIVSARS